ncbi:hypothetical protein Tco_1270099, partial [Tanacetum coccineum]
LVPSIPKSTAFFCNVPNHVKISILNIMPFAEGNLPVKYLGVPLISSRLLNKDCKVLVEKAKNRIEDWKNKSLSFAGRLKLCKSRSSKTSCTWAVLVVRVGRNPSNPSPPFGLVHNLTIEGDFGVECFPSGRGYRGRVRWEEVRGELESTWEVVWE